MRNPSDWLNIPRRRACGAGLLLSVLMAGENVALAVEAETNADKSAYTLLNPTPDALLRELNTDRPDKTESPYTVDAGHFQIESDLFTYTHDRDTSGGGDTRVDAWSFATLNLKAGLCNWSDFQVVLNPYNRVRTRDRLAGSTFTQSGLGDVTVRLKMNFWGNDGGTTAFGLMPFVKLPTSQDGLGNDSVEGGVIVPVAVKLPYGFDLGAMTEFDWNRDEATSGYHTEFVNTVTVGHNVAGKLDAYVEFFSAVSTERGSRWQGTFDFGFTYGLTENIQLDAGLNVGLTDSADDWNPFAGISIRF